MVVSINWLRVVISSDCCVVRETTEPKFVMLVFSLAKDCWAALALAMTFPMMVVAEPIWL